MIGDLAVDPATGAIGWMHGSRKISVVVPGALDARIEAGAGRVVALVHQDGESAALVLEADGREAARIAAPQGVQLSHFADGATLVGQGSAQIDDWWDWHFQADAEAGLLRRLGPAY
jgi:hypothetical protein